jgi:hypothetical protein
MDLLKEDPNLQGIVVDKLIEKKWFFKAQFYLTKYTLDQNVNNSTIEKLKGQC